jgi:hypothetical protein
VLACSRQPHLITHPAQICRLALEELPVSRQRKDKTLCPPRFGARPYYLAVAESVNKQDYRASHNPPEVHLELLAISPGRPRARLQTGYANALNSEQVRKHPEVITSRSC